MFKCGKLAEFVPELNIVFLVGFRRRICAEFNSHLDFFELLNLIRCGSNSAYELGLTIDFGIAVFAKTRWLFSYGVTFLPDARGDLVFD